MGRYVVQGLTDESMLNMVLDAGAFFVDLDIDGGEASNEVADKIKAALLSGKCLGATSGGGTFNAVPEARQIEADGMRYPIIGSTVFDKWDVHLTGTLKEVTLGNMQKILPTSEVDETTNALKIRTALSKDDYIKSLWWVGNRNDDTYVLIQLHNAVNVAGAVATFADKGEMTIPVDFRAHGSNLDEMEYAPFRWYFLGEPKEEA